MENKFIWWNGGMVGWWYLRNGDMMKFQNAIVFFSYLQLLLSQPFLNVLTGSVGGCNCQFLLHFRPSRPLQICVPLPLLHLHFFAHQCLKLHPYIDILLSPYFSLVLFLSVSLFLLTFIFAFIPVHFLFNFLLSYSSSSTDSTSPFLSSTSTSLLPSFEPQEPTNSMARCYDADFYVILMWNFEIMVKRWNSEKVKWIGTELWWNIYGEMVQIIHPCLYGEMTRWWNRAVQIIQRWNGETIILTFDSHLFIVSL